MKTYKIVANLNKKTYEFHEFINGKIVAEGTLNLHCLAKHTALLQEEGYMGTIEW